MCSSASTSFTTSLTPPPSNKRVLKGLPSMHTQIHIIHITYQHKEYTAWILSEYFTSRRLKKGIKTLLSRQLTIKKVSKQIIMKIKVIIFQVLIFFRKNGQISSTLREVYFWDKYLYNFRASCGRCKVLEFQAGSLFIISVRLAFGVVGVGRHEAAAHLLIRGELLVVEGRLLPAHGRVHRAVPFASGNYSVH